MITRFSARALRVDELHKIRVGNIVRDGEHTIIHIKGKGNEYRRSVMPPLAAGPVNKWIETAVFTTDVGGPLFRLGMTARGSGVGGLQRKPMTIRSGLAERILSLPRTTIPNGFPQTRSEHGPAIKTETQDKQYKLSL